MQAPQIHPHVKLIVSDYYYLLFDIIEPVSNFFSKVAQVLFDLFESEINALESSFYPFESLFNALTKSVDAIQDRFNGWLGCKVIRAHGAILTMPTKICQAEIY